MSLFKFELYKIAKQKSVWVTLCLMAAMSYLSLGYDFNPALEREMVQGWLGPVTQERIEQAERGQAELLQKRGEAKDEEQRLTESEQIRLSVYRQVLLTPQIEAAKEKRLQQLQDEDRYSTDLENRMVEKVHATVHASGTTYHAGPGLTVNFVEFGAALFMGIMLLIGLAPIYSKEYSSGVDHYILSSKHGRRAVVWAKVGAAFVYTAFVLFAWELLNLTVNFAKFGNEGWTTPIQYITQHGKPLYADSPYALSILDYHLIQLAVHFAAAESFALFIVLVSSLSRSSLTAFFTCGLIFGIPVFTRLPEMVSAFTYTNVLSVQSLFDQFQAVNVFGMPVLLPMAAVGVMAVLSVVYIRLLLQIMKHKEVKS